MPEDNDPMREFESIAAEADTYGAARHLGDLNQAFESGRLTRYCVVYEYLDDNNRPSFRVYWTSSEDIWARGAIILADEVIAEGIWTRAEEIED